MSQFTKRAVRSYHAFSKAGGLGAFSKAASSGIGAAKKIASLGYQATGIRSFADASRIAKDVPGAISSVGSAVKDARSALGIAKSTIKL